MTINQEFLDGLFEQAKESPRLRMNYDLRNSEHDGSQRMLNALLPGTEVAIHRHTRSSENIFCLCGKMDVILFEEEAGEKLLAEAERIHLCPANASYGCVVPAGTWHTVEVYDPSVIYEAKDGKYGEDGSETYNGKVVTSTNAASSASFHNYLGDLKKNIEYIKTLANNGTINQ